MADQISKPTEPNPLPVGHKDLGGEAEFALKVHVSSSDVPASGTPASSISGASVSVAATATLIAAANVNRRSLLIRNVGSVDVYLGPSGVTTSNGQKLAAGETLEDSATVAAWYGIVATGTCEVRTTEAT